MLGFMAVSGVIGWLNIRNLRIEVRFPDELYAGLPTRLAVRVTNRRRWLPSYLLRLHLGTTVTAIPELPTNDTHVGSVPFTFPDRGPGRLDLVLCSSPFPINFFVRSASYRLDQEYLVFPRPIQASAHGDDGARRTMREAPAAGRGNEGDLAMIVDYTGTEPLKMIHWRLSARHDELKVKQLSTTAGTPAIIDLQELSGDLEQRLSVATYLVNHFYRLHRPVGLRLGERLIPPADTHQHRLHLLGELARHDLR